MFKKIKNNLKKKAASSLYAEIQTIKNRKYQNLSGIKKLGPNSFFHGDKHILSGKDNLEIGENVHIHSEVFIRAEGGVEIGDNTQIDRFVTIDSLSPNYNGNYIPFDNQFISRKITIGKNVSIGMRVCILPGTQIGDGSIINMGAVVSGVIPPLSIVEAAKTIIVGERDKVVYQHLDEGKMYAALSGHPYKRRLKSTLDDIPGGTYFSHRSKSSVVNFNNQKAVKKTFLTTQEGIQAFDREVEAYSKFKHFPWCPQLFEVTENSIIVEYFPPGTRLDAVDEASPELLEEILWSLLDIFGAGYAHCDVHTRNLFVTENGIKITDFETIQLQDECNFFDSYDITGKGLVSPFSTNNMCLLKDDDISIANKFKIDSVHQLEHALNSRFNRQMLDSSITFKSLRTGSRHQLRTQNIYASFNLLNTKISPQVSQRNTSHRLNKFGISKDSIKRKRILDIGSNIGATLLGLSKYEPAQMLGLEYDADKVALSNKIANYNCIQNIVFQQFDVENSNAISEEFDVVFCLAVIEHLNQKEKLFEILQKVCIGTLYFEGNADSDIEYIQASLRNAGFLKIDHIGFSDDEKNEANNNRPLFIAAK